VIELLREEQGSGGSTTAEERVIGAGLQSIERRSDGRAVKELFHMLAVTQEDIVLPMPVIELLWRSCCASDAEKQEGSLTTKLKVRQWTQMLVDHSLLLGSSSEGVHLHDIVLQFLRKAAGHRLPELHRMVITGLERASLERHTLTGQGLQDSNTAHPQAGEEVDWVSSFPGPMLLLADCCRHACLHTVRKYGRHPSCSRGYASR